MVYAKHHILPFIKQEQREPPYNIACQHATSYLQHLAFVRQLQALAIDFSIAQTPHYYCDSVFIVPFFRSDPSTSLSCNLVNYLALDRWQQKLRAKPQLIAPRIRWVKNSVVALIKNVGI